MNLTKKQRQIMACVIYGNPQCEGEILKTWLDQKQLAEVVPYETSRESMQFSVRALMKKGLVLKGKKELRSGRFSVPIIPTDEALDFIPQLLGKTEVVDWNEDSGIVLEGFENE